MVQEDADSFVKFFKNESKTAAYLGYSDVTEYQKFRFSEPVLYTLIHLSEHCKNQNPKVPLSLIRDIKDRQVSFSDTIEALLAKYLIIISSDWIIRKQTNMNWDYIYAGILYHLMEVIEVTASDDRSYQEIVKSYKATTDKFESCFRVTLPTFNVLFIQYPDLGSKQELEEIEMKRYSWANAVLKSLQNLLSPMKWKEAILNSKGDVFASTHITEDALLTWMKSLRDFNVSLMNTAIMKQSRLTKSFTLHLDRSKMTRFSELLNQHIENHITYNGLRMPDEDMTAEKDPHAFPTGDMWRDIIQWQLQFAKLKVNFLTIDLQPTTSISVWKYLVYDSQNLRQGQTWTAVLEVLNEAESDEFIFTYTLQTVNDDEDEYSYEYDGPLLALQDEFQVTADNDIALLNKPVTITEDIKMNIPSGHHDENTELNIPSRHHYDDTEMNTSSGHHDDDTEMDITSEHLNEEALTDEQQKIQDFLSSGETTIHLKLWPDSLFGPNQREEMLRYHDGYDVSTPEGLLAWQHYALDKVAGNMLRLTKEKSIMKLFKEAHAEIQKAQTDSELAALSIDVRDLITLPLPLYLSY